MAVSTGRYRTVDVDFYSPMLSAVMYATSPDRIVGFWRSRRPMIEEDFQKQHTKRHGTIYYALQDNEVLYNRCFLPFIQTFMQRTCNVRARFIPRICTCACRRTKTFLCIFEWCIIRILGNVHYCIHEVRSHHVLFSMVLIQ